MTRRILEQTDINAAADALLSEGKKPTIGLLYEAVGRRGSNSTIQKMLATWEAERASTAPTPAQPEIPAPTLDALRTMGEKLAVEVFRAAKTQTDAEVALVIEGLKAQQAKLQEDLATAAKIELDREQDFTEVEQALTQAQAAHTVTQEHLVVAQTRVQDLQAEGAKKDERIAALESALEARTLEQKNLAIQNATLTAEAQAAAAKIGELVAKLAEVEHQLAASDAENRDLTERLIKRSAQEEAAQGRIKDLAAHVAALETAASKSADEAKQLNATIATQAERLGSLQASLDAAKATEFAAKTAEAAAVEALTIAKGAAHETEVKAKAAAKAHDREKERLERQIHDLEATIEKGKKS